MKAYISNSHRVVVKIVKKLDERMVRCPKEEEEAKGEMESDYGEEDFIPVPSCL